MSDYEETKKAAQLQIECSSALNAATLRFDPDMVATERAKAKLNLTILDLIVKLEAENHELCATPYAERVRENLALKENAAGDAATIAKLEATLRAALPVVNESSNCPDCRQILSMDDISGAEVFGEMTAVLDAEGEMEESR